jgi:hypothetical protein
MSHHATTRGDDMESGHIMVTAAYAKRAAEHGIHYPPDWILPDLGHPSAVCVMDWNRCTERWCEFYASGCPHFREDEPRCPRCGRVIATVGDGDPARIMDVTNENAEYAGADLCLRCAEYLDPTDF